MVKVRKMITPMAGPMTGNMNARFVSGSFHNSALLAKAIPTRARIQPNIGIAPRAPNAIAVMARH